jgi:4-hydroxy-tetrahydrodipicolinate reductase
MRVGVVGASGRMGQEVIKTILPDDSIQLACALVKTGHAWVGKDAGLCVGPTKASTVVSVDREAGFQQSDVIIDFTLPTATRTFLKLGIIHNTPLVIGTTGLNAEDKNHIQQAAQHIPIVYATNMSLGITLLTALVEQATATLGPDFDAEIVEMHHRYKQDAPSGTALTLGQAIAHGRHEDFMDVAVFNRNNGAIRQAGEIGFAALRGGAVFGEHQVLFAADEEIIELKHRALSRSVFAKGAVRAAKWLQDKKPGLYSMRDVLGL